MAEYGVLRNLDTDCMTGNDIEQLLEKHGKFSQKLASHKNWCKDIKACRTIQLSVLDSTPVSTAATRFWVLKIPSFPDSASNEKWKMVTKNAWIVLTLLSIVHLR